jgi:uncharacterized YccA/Bax inhibitor family protein
MAVVQHPTRRARRVERSTWVPRVGPGMVLGALGTIGVVVSMFLPWRTGDVHPSSIPFAFLFDHTTTSTSPSLLIALIPLAVILAVGTLLPRAAGARVLGGLLTLVVAGLFAFQLHEVLDAFPGSSLTDQLDSGFYVAAIGGFVGLVGGCLPSGWSRRRTVEDESGTYEQDVPA